MRLIKVTDSASNDEIVATGRWRVAGSFGSDAGLWTEIPLIPHHNADLCQAFIKPMGEYRRKLMGDRPHYCAYNFPSYSDGLTDISANFVG